MPKVIKLLDLSSFDNGQHRPPFPVPIGSTVIGRGDFLKCKSTEVSRSHATLIAESNGFLKLTTDNKKPCYYKHGGEIDKKILKQNESVELHHGDVFSLTATSSGYEVQVTDDLQCVSDEEKGELDISNADTNKDSEATFKQTEAKRKFPDWMNDSDEDEPKTRKKFTSSIENETSSEVASVPPAPNMENSDKKVELEQVSQETIFTDDQETDVQPPVVDEESEKSNDTFFEPEEETEEPENIPDDVPSASPVNTNVPSTSVSPPQRPACKYAEKCYRKNPQHKADFCHPGDPDYTTVVATPKPRCQYGTSCYRVNPQHKQDFDHTQPPITPPQSPKKKKAPRDAAQKKKAVDWDSGSEESYDESFIDDNSSDDYRPDDDTESDEDENWE